MMVVYPKSLEMPPISVVILHEKQVIFFVYFFSKVVSDQTDQGDWVVTFIVADCALTIINVQTIEAVIKQSIVTAAPSLKARDGGSEVTNQEFQV